MWKPVLLGSVVWLCIAGVLAADDAVDFVRDVRPIFERHCYECHGPKKQKSGLRLDVKAAALKGGDGWAPNIIPGDPRQSPLMQFVRDEDADTRMPPEGERLSEPEIATLTAWIAAGAKWPDGVDAVVLPDKRQHWAFQPIRRPALPEPVRVEPANAERVNAERVNVDWARNEVDRFILARLAEHGLSPSPEADRTAWLRRVYFNLIGLPPTPAQVAAFQADERPDAYARVVEQLLDSPRYGERWAQHWLDVIRYADTHGFEVNTPRDNAWPYRDYVIRSFNEDTPYDRFIREQLAGDAMRADAATGFLVAGAVLLPGQIGKDDESKRLARQDALDEIIVGAGGALLGLTIGCARCHDHKFDPISQRDYYAMQAFFAGVEYGDRPIDDAARQANLAHAAELAPRIAERQHRLSQLEPPAFAGQTLLIDETDESRVTKLIAPNGPGQNPKGTKRGYRDDVGDANRIGNLSGGSYTWWNNVAGQDVMTYNPGAAGDYRLWISWGVHGSGVHTRDARYVLDADGDLATRDDQRELARVDQYYPAGVRDGETEKTPQWSGLLDVGVVLLSPDSKLIVRGGETGTGITADVIVLQQVLPNSEQSNVESTNSESSNSETTSDATASTNVSLPHFRRPVSPLQNVERFAAVAAKFVRFTTLATIDDNRHQPCLDELEIYSADEPTKNVALASHGAVATSSGNYSETGIHQLRHVNDGLYGNDHSWISDQYGGGWVRIELPAVIEIDRVVWGRDRNGKFPDRLPVRYRIEVSLDGQQWRSVATHEDRLPIGTAHDPHHLLARHGQQQDVDVPVIVAEIADLERQKAELEQPRLTFSGKFREPDETFVLRRGDPEQRLDRIGPRVPELFANVSLESPEANSGAFDTPEQDRRMALADWVASPDNPLTARVMVNRVWQYHFGRGLVDTPNDFGVNGARPSHPELLDWLASEFIDSGWSIKHLQRLIVLSATYRQASQIKSAAADVDGDVRLLWRYPTRRLEAEAIRDSMLAISGELNLEMGGPGFNFFQTRGGLNGFPPVENFGPNELRRMIYQHKIRMEKVPVFGAFDCPDAGQAMPVRSQSTTAIQALNLFNSQFVMDRAAALAERIRSESSEVDGQVARAFALAFGREPSDAEQAACRETVDQHGLVPLCRVLFNSNEFLFVP